MRINPKSVARLSRYRTALYHFKTFNIPWIFSEQLAASLGFTAAQVRKDFSCFGITGKRKSGYLVTALLDKLNELLGKNQRNKAILTGFGALGKTLFLEYFKHDPSLEIMAAFSEDLGAAPLNPDEETGLLVLPASSLVNFVAANRIPFGIIAETGEKAQRYLDLMVLGGIKGVVNFSSMELKAPSLCLVRDINPVRELENVIYFTQRHRKDKITLP